MVSYNKLRYKNHSKKYSQVRLVMTYTVYSKTVYSIQYNILQTSTPPPCARTFKNKKPPKVCDDTKCICIYIYIPPRVHIFIFRTPGVDIIASPDV